MNLNFVFNALNLGILQNSWQELKNISDSRALLPDLLTQKIEEEDCSGILHLSHKSAGSSHGQSGLGTNDIGAPVSDT